MNKLFCTMCMVGGFAVLLGSCKKNDEAESLAISLPAFEEEVDGRAYIDFANGGAFKWEGNDQVVIYNLDNRNGTNSQKAIYQCQSNAAGQATSRFSYYSGDRFSAKKFGYFAFYPVAKVNEAGLNENNYETFSVPNMQVYKTVGNTVTVDPAGMAMATDLPSLGASVNLKHIFGVLRLKIKGNGSVNGIEVIDERFNLSGTASMKLHEVKMDVFTTLQNRFAEVDDPYADDQFLNTWNEYKSLLNYSANGTGKTMTLAMDSPISLLGPTEEQHFIIGLRPGALKYGFTVKVYLQGENEPVVFDFTGANNLHYGIKAGKIKSLTLEISD